MRKENFMRIFLAIILACLLIYPQIGRAANVFATATNVATYTIYEYDFNQLVFDFTLQTTAGTDYLEALTLVNIGPYYNFGIAKMCLYADAGAAGFQGWGTDKTLGCGTWRAVDNYWYWQNLNLPINESAARLFAAVETDILSSNQKYIQIGIPAFLDNNDNGMFDIGDRGFFTLAKQNGPAAQVATTDVIYLKYIGSDTTAPVVIFDNLKDGQEITADKYFIAGESRDRGSSGMKLVEISINGGAWQTVATSDNYAHWTYDWANYIDGLYVVKSRGTDIAGLTRTNDGIVISVNRKNQPNITLSTFVLNKKTLFANGVDYVAALVTVKNSDGEILSGKNVSLLWSKVVDNVAGEATESAATTNMNGQALFKIKSNDVGTFNLEIKIEGVKLNNSETVQFIAESIDYTNGQLIRWSGSKTVYFLDKNNVRHPYPTQGVYESYWGKNFSLVKILSADEIAKYEIGKNVPFKIGTLMKIQTVPKVYRIGNDGKRQWIVSEAVAKKLYGVNWNKLIYDLPEILFTDYEDGAPITE
jgi:hypothetical protein